MEQRGWSSEERRVALEQVSKAITERTEKAREERHGISAEACVEFQAMQVAIDLQCRVTHLESVASRALDRASKYMDRLEDAANPEFAR
jgi:hypothetical protein